MLLIIFQKYKIYIQMWPFASNKGESGEMTDMRQAKEKSEKRMFIAESKQQSCHNACVIHHIFLFTRLFEEFPSFCKYSRNLFRFLLWLSHISHLTRFSFVYCKRSTLNIYFIFLKNNYWHFFQKVGRLQIIGTFFKKVGAYSNK